MLPPLLVRCCIPEGPPLPGSTSKSGTRRLPAAGTGQWLPPSQGLLASPAALHSAPAASHPLCLPCCCQRWCSAAPLPALCCCHRLLPPLLLLPRRGSGPPALHRHPGRLGWWHPAQQTAPQCLQRPDPHWPPAPCCTFPAPLLPSAAAPLGAWVAAGAAAPGPGGGPARRATLPGCGLRRRAATGLPHPQYASFHRTRSGRAGRSGG